MLMRTTSEGILSSINIGYFELNDIPYLLFPSVNADVIARFNELLYSSVSSQQ